MSSSDWIIIPTIGKNKKCSKPPISVFFVAPKLDDFRNFEKTLSVRDLEKQPADSFPSWYEIWLCLKIGCADRSYN